LRKTREFNEYTQKYPQDIEKWLQYISFQDELLKLQNHRNTTAIIEKKIAIYEKALSHNPKSSILLSGHLRESSKLYSFDRVNTGWQTALKRCPSDDTLWHEYILFKRSNFSHFSVSNMRSEYSRLIANLLDQKTQINNIVEMEQVEYRLIKLFYESCIFEQQSGFNERAIALCQAMIELNFNSPYEYNNNTWEQQMNRFGEFWQSETPRFGEEGAKGWNNWLLTSVNLNNGNMDDDEENFVDDVVDKNDDDDEQDLLDIVNEKSVYVQWLKEEERRSASQFLPCRTNQIEVIESCPDRIILWEDISDSLFSITTAKVQRELIFILLEIAGVSIYYSQKTIHDPLVHESMMNKDDSKHLLSLFTTKREDKFEFWKPQAVLKQNSLISLIRNVFQQAINIYSNDVILCMSYLDFEMQIDLANAKLVAKQLLRENRENLLLWNQYALLEKKCNQIGICRKVYDSTLTSMSADTPSNIQCLLYRCYAEIELSNNNIQRAIHILCCAIEHNYQQFDDGVSTSTARILKTKQLFDSQYNTIKQDHSKIITHTEFIMLYTLFEYLTTNGSVSNSTIVFQQILFSNLWPHEKYYHHVFTEESKLNLGTVHEQYLWLLYLKFLHVHVPLLYSIDRHKYEIVSRRQMRTTLAKFLERFPAHPLGLNIYIEMEQQSHISSYRSRFMDHMLTVAPSPITFLFAVYAELLRGGHESHNRIRSLFEKSLENQVCRSNVMLWRMYIRFEISISHFESAKKLFYRAIDKCPQSKVLWLDVIKLFKDYFTMEDLKELIDLMNEKEILMRSNIEEFVVK
jgi:hypothetical protein